MQYHLSVSSKRGVLNFGWTFDLQDIADTKVLLSYFRSLIFLPMSLLIETLGYDEKFSQSSAVGNLASVVNKPVDCSG